MSINNANVTTIPLWIVIPITAITTNITDRPVKKMNRPSESVTLVTTKVAVMESIIKFETISQYSSFNNNETKHPLVAIVDLSKADPRLHMRMNLGFYTVFFKEIKCGDLKYGCNYYDYEEGTLVFVAPGQVLGIENNKEYYQPHGRVLVFHPDLIRGTALGRHINDYTFFSYEVFEALHLSEGERKIIMDCLFKIEFELNHAIDKHSKKLFVINIELFWVYCLRF